MITKKLSLTVGIPTCYGSDSILKTVESLRGSNEIEQFRLIIVADRTPINAVLKKQLKKLGVELYENSYPNTQCYKKKQILAKTSSDIVIYTQDDVLFDPETITLIMKRFRQDSKIDFISIYNQPAESKTLFESVVSVGTNLTNRIAKNWNKGNNYLSCIGRCMAFRTKWVRKFYVPNEVVSSDAYYYFQNKRYHGKYTYDPNIKVYYKNPQNIREHLRKSSRFQHSKLEMTKYFGNLDKEYKVPALIIIRAIIGEVLTNPINSFLYFCLFIYSRLFRIQAKKSLNAIWEIDLSTKTVI